MFNIGQAFARAMQDDFENDLKDLKDEYNLYNDMINHSPISNKHVVQNLVESRDNLVTNYLNTFN